MTGQDVERLDGDLVLPLTGEIVSLGDPPAVARALAEVRQLKGQLDDARAVLEDVLRAESERVGSRTLHFGDLDAVVSGGERTEYDAEELIPRLRAAGLPEERLEELVRVIVEYRVDQRVARSVAASNPDYAAVLERCRRGVPAPWRVSIKRGGSS